MAAKERSNIGTRPDLPAEAVAEKVPKRCNATLDDEWRIGSQLWRLLGLESPSGYWKMKHEHHSQRAATWHSLDSCWKTLATIFSQPVAEARVGLSLHAERASLCESASSPWTATTACLHRQAEDRRHAARGSRTLHRGLGHGGGVV